MAADAVGIPTFDYVSEVGVGLLSALRRWRLGVPFVLALSVAMATTMAVGAASLVHISTDLFTNSTSQHHTEVEPDTFSSGSTIIATMQQGRFNNGGASDIGWATSTDNGQTWTSGSLPGITVFQGNGPYDRVSDPSVAYDPNHNAWLITGLAIKTPGGSVNGAGVTASRSTDGGLTWANPVNVAVASIGQNFDKEWIVCDTTSTSPFYGNCYVEWDDNGSGNLITMSTSSDGGLTWGPAKHTGNNATGIGGQPVVQPGGQVIVPIDNAFEGSLLSFSSTNGGTSWSSTVTASTIQRHIPAGGIRSGPLPSAAIDSAGKVYVVWQDCRFRTSCKSNDIVMTTSTDGTTWSSVQRIPIDPTTSTVDHFIPGIAADPATSSPSVHLGLSYYYYPKSSCTFTTCKLDVGYVSSADGGATWTAPTKLAGAMMLSWLAQTTQGSMVGDYISTSYVGGKAVPVLMKATLPTGSTFHEAAFAPVGGLSAEAGTLAATSEGAQSSSVGEPASTEPATAR